MSKMKLGKKVVDNITGFKGTVTGRVEYLTGCRQYLVAPKAQGNKYGDSVWLDEDRLISKSFGTTGFTGFTGYAGKSLKAKTPGGPQEFEAPIK